jgi:predicted transcriptional regulator
MITEVMDLRKRLGKLELQVMKLVWGNGVATVRDVWEKLYPEKGLAYTTVATVMRKLESKGFLKHDEKDRTYIYRPVVDQSEVSQGLLGELIDGIFDGSAANLITTLIQSERLTEKDLNQIQRVILEHQEGDGDD